MLTINNLSKKFNNTPILDSISLSVDKGNIALLLGESGVGKSTLLRILNNLETADSGSVTLDGTMVDVKSKKKNYAFGMIFQQWNLFEHLTAMQNITLPLEIVLKKSKKDAQAIAYTLLLHFGLEAKANDAIAQLSGGQKQRLAIARALALNPQVLCADEPTSALDPSLTHFVAKNIQQLADDGLTVVVASHDTALITHLRCTIYLMKAGKIVQTAQSQDFLANRSNYPLINSFVTSA